MSFAESGLGYLFNFLLALSVDLNYFRINFLEELFQDHYHSVKQIGPRTGLTTCQDDMLSDLIWVKTFC